MRKSPLASMTESVVFVVRAMSRRSRPSGITSRTVHLTPRPPSSMPAWTRLASWADAPSGTNASAARTIASAQIERRFHRGKSSIA